MKIYNNGILGYKAIIVLFTIIQISIVSIIALTGDYECYVCQNYLLSNRIILFFSFLLIVITCFIVIFLEQKIIRINIFLFLLVASIALFGLQLFITNYIYFYPGWDARGIRITVEEFIRSNGNIEVLPYPFSTYPNNINITAIYIFIYKGFNYFGLSGYKGLLIFSNLSVNLAGVCTFLCTYKLTQKPIYAIFSWGFYVLLVALSPWVTIPYTDTYSILFPILSFTIYISRKSSRKNYFSWFLISFISIFGYSIKPPTIIVFVAIILIESWKLISNFERNLLLHKFISCLAIIAAIIPNLLINSTIANYLKFDINDNRRFTMLHYIMMGLEEKTDGVFSLDDYLFSSSFNTVEERNTENFSVIKQRLKRFGINGYLQFLPKKALVNFSDGSFAWSIEGDFYDQTNEKDGSVVKILRSFYYERGANYLLFLTSVQIFWYFILLLLLGLCLLINKAEYKICVLIVTIIGIYFFVMLFEARARYLFSFTPFFISGAGIAIYNINLAIVKRKLFPKYYKKYYQLSL